MSNTEKKTAIPMDQWGKDHWSLLAYVECRCVDNDGHLDARHMRDKTRGSDTMGGGWSPKYGTRTLIGMQREHDDFDVMEDLRAEGLVDSHTPGRSLRRRVALLPRGQRICVALRAHKADGGQFNEFRWTDSEPTCECGTGASRDSYTTCSNCGCPR